jgi:hypothetical protein
VQAGSRHTHLVAHLRVSAATLIWLLSPSGLRPLSSAAGVDTVVGGDARKQQHAGSMTTIMSAQARRKHEAW